MQEPRIRVLELFFLLLLVALSYGLFMVLRPFILDIFLAIMFASVMAPFHERLASRLRGHRAPLDLERAFRSVGADAHTPRQERRVKRRRPESRVTRSGQELGEQTLEPGKDPSHP